VVVGGVIAYENAVKRDLLGVTQSDLTTHGAVSEPVARQMAIGARDRFSADATLAITGIAGPGGGTSEKPVGTVWVAMALGGEVTARRLNVIGDRDEVRRRSAQSAMGMLRRALGEVV